MLCFLPLHTYEQCGKKHAFNTEHVTYNKFTLQIKKKKKTNNLKIINYSVTLLQTFHISKMFVCFLFFFLNWF